MLHSSTVFFVCPLKLATEKKLTAERTLFDFFSAEQHCSIPQREIQSDVMQFAECFVVTAAIMWLNLSTCDLFKSSMTQLFGFYVFK